MKKKILILICLIVLIILSFLIPVRKEKVWINDDPIYEVGHYEIHIKNIYGYTLKKEK